uniref:RHS repeat-associated core domain-containing protein n=1 Tax=Tenacibaculum aiptasiae TaxID=426481 RepID=UPI002491868E
LASITSKLNDLGYQYKYDHRNRLVEKRIPGKDWEYIVYDKLDRPVLTQDANLRAENKWLFTKYDALGRVAYTGTHLNLSIIDRVTMQNTFNSHNNIPSKFYEERTNSGIHYNNSNFPSNDIELLTINYYDDYAFDRSGAALTVTNFDGKASTSNAKSLATGNKVRVLGTNNWITTVTYYDEKARPIYVYSKNGYLQTTDIVESKLDDFTGRVLETKTTHKKTGHVDVVTVDSFEYDYLDRLISQTQKINNQVSNRIVKNNYDELGQLTSKVVGNGVVKGYKDVTSGISISGDMITKTGSNGWDAGLATMGSIQTIGFVEYKLPKKYMHFMVGLSEQNTDAYFGSISYAIYNAGTAIQVFEKGELKGVFGNSELNDVFKIERIGNTIYYKKNNITFYTSQTQSSGSLLGDISMYSEGAQIKDLKIVDNNKGLQTVDYKYNVRGWLKNINQDANNDNDLFNFSLKYNDITDANKRLYNGNISQTNWNTLNTDTSSRTYTYSYDALNRITVATGSLTHNYTLSSVYYDKNGNITYLRRNGHTNSNATSFGLMDQLYYSYDAGNKLLGVRDDGNDTYGFKDGTNTGNDYTYDANGNMKTDANKGITNIVYNHLNLPTQVTIGGQNISYTYDAAGMKLKKVVNGTTTEYAGNYMYENNVLQFFNHPEGYVKKDNTGFKYVYQYKDHLGNVRLSYTDSNNDGVITPSTEIVEESNYYPFGLKHKGYNSNVSSLGNSVAQKFGYNGKELEESLGLNWLEYGARNYNSSLGRFMNIDRFAEKYESINPYQYTANNPILFVDVNGDWIYINDGSGDNKKQYRYENGKTQYKNSDGNWVSAKDQKLSDFVISTVSEIKALEDSGKTGKSIIEAFSNDDENVYLNYEKNAARREGNNLFFDPETKHELETEKGTDSKFTKTFTILGHEFSHVLDKRERNVWFSVFGGGDVSDGEIYATHIENLIRAESGQPLRMFYTVPRSLQSMVVDFNGKSLYIDKDGNFPTQTQIKNILDKTGGVIIKERFNYREYAKKNRK